MDRQALAKLIQQYHPNGDQFSDKQAEQLAVLVKTTGMNPFSERLRIYVSDTGQLRIHESHQTKVAHAQEKSAFTHRFERLSKRERKELKLASEDVAYRCLILKQNSQELFRTVLQANLAEKLSYQVAERRAYRVAATVGIGTVRASEMVDEEGCPIEPLEVSWDKVARRRALSNGLRDSHGSAIEELIKQSFQLDGTTTELQDWLNIPPHIQGEARQCYVKQKAQQRQEATLLPLAKRVDLLRGKEETGIE